MPPSSTSSSSSPTSNQSTDHFSHHQKPKGHRSKHQLGPASALRLPSRQHLIKPTQTTAHERRMSNYSTSSTILTNITASETYSSLLKQIRSTDRSSTPSSYNQERQRLMLTSYGAQSPIKKTIGTLIKSGQSRTSIISYSILFILLWKSLIGLGHYSGYRSPPLFGDLEAQRHWMAVTVQLKLKQWYSFDLKYWGLDYPPLTAYHSLLLGYLARLIDPAFVLLRPPSNHPNGWGEELHQQLKVFLRSSVLASELILWIPIVFIYHFKTFTFNSSPLDSSDPLPQESNPRLSNGLWLGAMYSVLVVLLNPNMILIDNGHFQFNSIMLGFTLASVTCLYAGRDLWGAVMFVCSLAFKQMALYYSPAIFAYLFGKCLYLGHPRGTKLFARLALISTGTTILLFGPFLFNSDFPTAIIQVIQRIFPIGRGLFEDKVGNFWCTLNLFIKVRTLASVKTLANVALLFTLVAVLPVILLLTILSWKLNPNRPSVSSSSLASSKVSLLPLDRPNPIPKTIELLPHALYNSSIGFYLFSFQVHEKSILLPILPLLLILSRHHRNRKRGQLVNRLDWDIICLISNVSVFSMWPLLKREQLGVQYMVSVISYNHLIGYNPLKLIQRSTRSLVSLGIMSIYLTMISIHLSEKLINPPGRLPDLFVVLNHALSFVIFSASYLWSLLRIYEEAWTLVGFGRLSHHPQRTVHHSVTKTFQQDHNKSEFENGKPSNSGIGDVDEDSSEALQVKLPAKRSSSLQQHRRKKKSGSCSEGEELKSRSFGATPRMLKVVGPLPQRMLKEPAGPGSRPSSKAMISSPSGEKLMNRIKNRLLVASSRSASPSSSSSTSHRSSSLEDHRRASSKGKEKEDQTELEDQGGNLACGEHSDHSYPKELEYHLQPQHHHPQDLVAVAERGEPRQPNKQEEKERAERLGEEGEREKASLPSSPYRLESVWELALRQSREEAIRRRREELLATRTPTNSSSKR